MENEEKVKFYKHMLDAFQVMFFREEEKFTKLIDNLAAVKQPPRLKAEAKRLIKEIEESITKMQEKYELLRSDLQEAIDNPAAHSERLEKLLDGVDINKILDRKEHGE